jgi:hypothetical protein
MSPLLSASALMSQSWQFFTAHWKPLLKRTSWLLLIFVLYLVFAIPAAMKEAWGAYAVIFVLYLLAMIVAINHLNLYVLKEDSVNASNPNFSRRALDLLGPALWVIVLSLIALSLASIAFIIPAIWLSISLSFAHLLLLEDDHRGVAALRASYNLVKGRWWATFWRTLAPGVATAILIWIVSFVIWSIVGLVAGGSLFGIFMAMGSEASAGANIAGGFAGTLLLILMVIAGFILQLGVLFAAFCYPMIVRVKLFHALKQTQSLPQSK